MKNNLKKPFLRAITTLASGSIVAQIITFATSPIMTRLYTTEEIGIYTLILTAVSMFGGVICGRYDMSIVYEEDEDNVIPIIKLSFIVCLLMSTAVSCGYGIYYWITGKDNNSYLSIIAFTFILLFATGIVNILISYNNRNREYSLMTSVFVIRTIAKNVTMVILGFLNAGTMGILFSEVIGQLFGMNGQARSLKPHLKDIYRVSTKRMTDVAKKHHSQPLYSVPAIFANNFSYSSINLFIESLFGLSFLGYYSMSFRILGMPLSLISTNVSKVFFEEASREYNQTKQFKIAFRKTSLFLVAVAIPMVIGMIWLAPPLFGWFFGNGWEVSGKYVQILAPMFGVRFIVSALTPGMIICGKQKLELKIQLLFAVMSIAAFIITKLAHLTINKYLMVISISFSVVILFII